MSLFRKLGELAGPKVRKATWVWQSVTGSEEDILKAEAEVGRDLAAAMKQGLGVDPDPDLAANIRAIGNRLVATVADRRRSFDFTVLLHEEPNAFALPGGSIFITRPLIELIAGEVNQVACILGHEMAHVIKQDPMNRLMSDTAIGAALKAVRLAGPVGNWVSSTGAQLMRSAYSQDQELFADRLGARLAHAAGYDPRAALHMLKALSMLHTEHPEIPLAEYFATHPPFRTRIAELESYLATLR
jgi:predicted Zn-dependent protease